MKKGFTLIELLAVIVIMAIILIIAIPQISKVIKNSKSSTLLSDAKIIFNQIDIKSIDKTIDMNTIDETNIETILGINSDNYEKLNVKIIDNKTYLFIKGKDKWSDLILYGTYDNLKTIDSTNPTYYINNNIVLQYDGIYNGGVNVHNDNTSTNKGIWKDLSSNQNDGILSNFGYTSTSGWTANAIKLDGSDDIVTSQSDLLNYSTYTYELLFKPFNYRYTKIGTETLHFKWRQISENPYWNFYDINNVANSNQYTYTPELNKIYLLTASYNGTRTSIYLNGKLNRSINKVITPKQNATFKIGIVGELAYGEVYAIRVYNRALTDEEIFYNYLVDKSRYNF